MELKPTGTAIFLLFLLLVSPCSSRGGLEMLDTEIYEIDYRGPETHSSIPPPDHSHRVRRESAVASRKGLKGGNLEGNAGKIHG